VIMAHAQELRDHRRTILELESRIIVTAGRAEDFEALFAQKNEELLRLRQRKAVRTANALARPFRGPLVLLRRAVARLRGTSGQRDSVRR